MKITPDIALLQWQITMLEYLKTYEPSDDPIYDLYVTQEILDDSAFTEAGLEPISPEAQRRAYAALSNKLHITPVLPYTTLPNGTRFEDDQKPILAHTIGVLDISVLETLINEMQSVIKGRTTVTIDYELGVDSIALVVNGIRIEAKGGTWRYAIIRALMEGGNETNANDIQIRQEVSPKEGTNFIRNQIRLLNDIIKSKTGFSKLLKAGKVVIYNQDDYSFIFQ